ncbi:MAG: class II fructose-bisphosphate aldolase [Candidatus Yanofskybacteria bacterium]|nr:class II fructose-bisphosphate aldolase [Candidatus Yanofskybacteria bacterium]
MTNDKNLKTYLSKAQQEHWAIGHFNFSTAEQLKAIVEAAAELKSPVMVATSEGEAEFVGYDQAVALVKSYQQAGYAVWLNADHHKSFESAKKAIDAGYDTVLIDASRLNLDENIGTTSQVVQYAHRGLTSIMVEGELGYLRGSSEVQEKVEINPTDYTQPEQAADFVARTGVERLAVVFGNIHGIVTEVITTTPTPNGVGAPTEASGEEKLDIEHLKKITVAVPETILVLHGASGLPDEDVRAAIAAGISNVHINTELRVAYHDTLHAELEKEPNQTTPYKFLASSQDAMKELVKKKLKLFGSVDKI